MQALLKSFWDIALWRRDPSHLPDSSTLLWLTAAAYAAFSAVQSWMIYGSASLLGRTAADLGITLLLVWLLLALTGRRGRFNQTASAVLGTGALLSPLIILLLALRGPGETSQLVALLLWVGSVGVVLWYVFIVGHIVRAALDTGLFTGVGLAVAFVLASATILTSVFPEGA